MTAYEVRFVKSAKKEFEHLSAQVRAKVTELLRLLAVNPFSEFLQPKKLKGADALYRVRVGDYRVVYEVRRRELVVLVINVGHRRDVYRHLQ